MTHHLNKFNINILRTRTFFYIITIPLTHPSSYMDSMRNVNLSFLCTNRRVWNRYLLDPDTLSFFFKFKKCLSMSNILTILSVPESDFSTQCYSKSCPFWKEIIINVAIYSSLCPENKLRVR